MSKQAIIIRKLARYFQEQGGIPESQEAFRADKNAPIRLVAVRRYLGPWSRATTKIKKAMATLDEALDIVEEIVEVLDPEEPAKEEAKVDIIPPKPVGAKSGDKK